MKLHNAKIIKADASPDEYGAFLAIDEDMSVIKRGDPRYCMSRSELMRFAFCPHGWLEGGQSDEETKSTEWGTLVDTMLLRPGAFLTDYVVLPATYPDSKTGEPKKWNMNATYCKDWVEGLESDGHIVIKPHVHAEAIKAKSRALADPEVLDILANSKNQVLVYAEYHDEATGVVVPLKALLDVVPPTDHPKWGKAIGDLKTGMSAHPSAWPKAVHQHDYDAQGWLYLQMYKAATGEDRESFFHIVQDNWAPYEIGRRILTTEFLDIGRDKIMHALQYYARCLKQNRWPGYDDDAKDQYHGFSFCKPEEWMVSKQRYLPILPPIEKQPAEVEDFLH